MYIKNILIDGFGKFVDESFSFNKNINLIIGKNESGKTTLLNFIFAILFGFKDSNGDIVEEYHKFKPWNSNSYGGEMTFYLDDSPKEYTIKRNFLTGDVFLYEGQKDITNSVNYDPNGEISFIREKTGFSRDGVLSLFKHTDTHIEQSGLNDYIIKLENFMEKENDTIIVKNSLLSIENAIDRIGDISDPYSPLGELSNKSKELENKLNSLKEKYKEIWNIQEQCNSLQNEINSLAKRKNNIIDQIKSYKVKDILNKLNHIKTFRKTYDQLKSEISQIEKYKDVDSSELISLERLEATSVQLKKNLENVESKYDKAIQRLNDLEKNIEIYEQKFKIRDFSDVDKLYLKVRNINLSHGIIKEKMKMLKSLEEELDALRKESEKLLKDFTSVNDKLLMLGDIEDFNNRVESYLKEKENFEKDKIEKSYSVNARVILTDKNTGKFSFAFFIGILIALAGFLIGFFINPWLYLIGAGGLSIMFIYLFEMIKTKHSMNLLSNKIQELKESENAKLSKFQEIEKNILKSLQIAGIKDIEQYKILYEKYISIKGVNNSKIVDEKTKEMQKLKSSIDVAIMELNKDLSDFNIISDGNIEAAILKLNGEIENYKNLSFEKGKLVEDSNKFKLEITELKRKLKEISDNILASLTDLGFDDIASYRIALDKKDRYFKLFTQLKEVEVELEKADAESQEELEKYINENKYLLDIEPKATEKQLKLQLNDLEVKINAYNLKLKDMQTSLQENQSSVENIGYVKAKLAYLNYRVNNMIDEKNKLSKLYSVMNDFYDNVRKDFIPRLNDEVSKIFNSIVENDNYEIKLNDNLEVEVIYNNENITSNISTGTYHQLALSLKLALASIMSIAEESLSILLDDAFSEYDSERIKPTVKFLKSISKNVQVVISTCRLDVKDVAKNLKFKIIDLG